MTHQLPPDPLRRPSVHIHRWLRAVYRNTNATNVQHNRAVSGLIQIVHRAMLSTARTGRPVQIYQDELIGQRYDALVRELNGALDAVVNSSNDSRRPAGGMIPIPFSSRGGDGATTNSSSG